MSVGFGISTLEINYITGDYTLTIPGGFDTIGTSSDIGQWTGPPIGNAHTDFSPITESTSEPGITAFSIVAASNNSFSTNAPFVGFRLTLSSAPTSAWSGVVSGTLSQVSVLSQTQNGLTANFNTRRIQCAKG